MTGFGRAMVSAGGRRYAVEVRSVNSRGLEVKARGSGVDAACEREILQATRVRLARGSVLVSVRAEGEVVGPWDVDRVRATHRALESLQKEMGLPGPVDLATVAAFLRPGPEGGGEAAYEWEALRPAVESALEAMQKMRAQEGRALAVDLGRRLADLQALVSRIQAAARALPDRMSRRLEERISALLPSSGAVDPGRLAQEVALLAEKGDVTEELIRLETHLAHLDRLFSASEPSGRKIDFVIQEIGRELNTVASKVQDTSIVALVIDGKAELEKIREQAQNIE